nr:MAG TPA: hypothetical protein [Caudoviricetes sp.]
MATLSLTVRHILQLVRLMAAGLRTVGRSHGAKLSADMAHILPAMMSAATYGFQQGLAIQFPTMPMVVRALLAHRLNGTVRHLTSPLLSQQETDMILLVGVRLPLILALNMLLADNIQEMQASHCMLFGLMLQN